MAKSKPDPFGNDDEFKAYLREVRLKQIIVLVLAVIFTFLFFLI